MTKNPWLSASAVTSVGSIDCRVSSTAGIPCGPAPDLCSRTNTTTFIFHAITLDPIANLPKKANKKTGRTKKQQSIRKQHILDILGKMAETNTFTADHGFPNDPGPTWSHKAGSGASLLINSDFTSDFTWRLCAENCGSETSPSRWDPLSRS